MIIEIIIGIKTFSFEQDIIYLKIEDKIKTIIIYINKIINNPLILMKFYTSGFV